MVSELDCLIISPKLIIRSGKALDYESRDSQFDPVCVQKFFGFPCNTRLEKHYATSLRS